MISSFPCFSGSETFKVDKLCCDLFFYGYRQHFDESAKFELLLSTTIF